MELSDKSFTCKEKVACPHLSNHRSNAYSPVCF